MHRTQKYKRTRAKIKALVDHALETGEISERSTTTEVYRVVISQYGASKGLSSCGDNPKTYRGIIMCILSRRHADLENQFYKGVINGRWDTWEEFKAQINETKKLTTPASIA